MRVSFFDDFKGADTILFSGMGPDLHALMDVLGLLVRSDDPNLVIKVEELPFADVAERMAIKEPAARALVSRALRALATSLDPEIIVEGATS